LFIDNSSASGGALYSETYVPAGGITAESLTAWRNSQLAMTLGVDVLMQCSACDFGDGANDNVPLDARKAGMDYADLDADFSL